MLTSTVTGHCARSVGDGGWVVTLLPGRTVSHEQARAALRVAELVAALQPDAASLGLTVLELVGLASMDCTGQRAFSPRTNAEPRARARWT